MLRFLAALALLACLPVACGVHRPDPGLASIMAAAKTGKALAISDALEALIAEGRDTPHHREVALEMISAHPEDTAAYAFARAAVAGRVLQSRGLFTGALLVGDVAHWGLVSRKLDPEFREGAATRLLGILCTQAPPALLPSGCDAEQGIAMLIELVKKHPNNVENDCRLAEAFIVQGDLPSALPELCICVRRKAELRHDEQKLPATLRSNAGNPHCPDGP
jgi:hypothetical protein